MRNVNIFKCTILLITIVFLSGACSKGKKENSANNNLEKTVEDKANSTKNDLSKESVSSDNINSLSKKVIENSNTNSKVDISVDISKAKDIKKSYIVIKEGLKTFKEPSEISKVITKFSKYSLLHANKELSLKEKGKEVIWIECANGWVLKKYLDYVDVTYPLKKYIIISDNAALYKEPSESSKMITKIEKYNLIYVIKEIKVKSSQENNTWILDSNQSGGKWILRQHLKRYPFKDTVSTLKKYRGIYYNINKKEYKKLKTITSKYKSGKLTKDNYYLGSMSIYGGKEEIILSYSSFDHNISHEETVFGDGHIISAKQLENNTISLKLYGFISKKPLPLPYEEGDEPLPKSKVVTVKFKIIGDKMIYNDKVFYKINLYR